VVIGQWPGHSVGEAMRLLHVFAARRSGVGLILAGVVVGVVLALTIQSLMRDTGSYLCIL